MASQIEQATLRESQAASRLEKVSRVTPLPGELS